MVVRHARTVLTLIVVAWVILFWRLGFVGLVDDEAHYARLTLEMMAHGSWLVPLLGGVPFIDKPVLFHWVQASATAVVADGELAARLPSAVAALVLFGITAWLGRFLGDRKTGAGAWLMLATVPATFFLGRTGYLDMVFTALVFGAVALILRTTIDGHRAARAAAVGCIALAVLTKGPIAVVLIGAWLAAAWLLGGESRQTVSRLRWVRAAMWVGVLASPWFLWMYWQFGDAFIQGYLVSGHTGYLTPRASASSSDWTFYGRMFLTAFFPWSLIAVGFGIDTARRRWRGVPVPMAEAWLWLWIGVVLAVFSAAAFRVDRYIFPAAPACCLLAYRGWLAARESHQAREFVATRVATALTALLIAGGGAWLWWSLPGLALGLPQTAVVLPVALIAGGVTIMVTMGRSGWVPPRLAGSPIAVLLFAYGAAVWFGLPAVRDGLPVETVGRFIASHSQPGEPVAMLGLERWETGLRFYMPDLPTRLNNAAEAERFAGGTTPRWLVTRREWYDSMRRDVCEGTVAMSVPAIVGTTGRGLRTQRWSDVVVVRFTGAAPSCP